MPHVDIWELAEEGECDYCGEEEVLVFPDPFGQKPACHDCFNQIVADRED